MSTKKKEKFPFLILLTPGLTLSCLANSGLIVHTGVGAPIRSDSTFAIENRLLFRSEARFEGCRQRTHLRNGPIGERLRQLLVHRKPCDRESHTCSLH
ncbi:hypothetical protein AVEN_53455-1 [Araneus ventricosus]|uniref:Uncharacterized protein n=1 Tax=Araneus ventricosus TaxID=182803 RepID=A0A4Y2AC38_ARAVE|nr:hypothetical protein AVEN_53455-1 [Araneus ventricosus]